MSVFSVAPARNTVALSEHRLATRPLSQHRLSAWPSEQIIAAFAATVAATPEKPRHRRSNRRGIAGEATPPSQHCRAAGPRCARSSRQPDCCCRLAAIAAAVSQPLCRRSIRTTVAASPSNQATAALAAAGSPPSQHRRRSRATVAASPSIRAAVALAAAGVALVHHANVSCPSSQHRWACSQGRLAP